jgi:hypothetical protein
VFVSHFVRVVQFEMTIMAIRKVVKMVHAVDSAVKAASDTRFLEMDRQISVVVRVSGGPGSSCVAGCAVTVGRAYIAAEMTAKGRKFLLCLSTNLIVPVVRASSSGWSVFVVWSCVSVFGAGLGVGGCVLSGGGSGGGCWLRSSGRGSRNRGVVVVVLVVVGELSLVCLHSSGHVALVLFVSGSVVGSGVHGKGWWLGTAEGSSRCVFGA